MRSFSTRLRSWTQDLLLRRVVRNSSSLFIGQLVAAVMSIVTANLLGAGRFGALGILTGFVTDINRLFSFRMSEAVVRYFGEALEQGDHRRAAAVVKAAARAESGAGLLSFGVVALVAPLAARLLTQDASLAPLYLLYGVTILSHLVVETATGVLQVTGHFRSQGAITLVQSLLVAVLVVGISLSGGGLVEVLIAYLIGKAILGIGPLVLALYWLPRTLGADWWRAPLSLLPDWRDMARFAFSTNVSGTINLVARDSEVPFVGFFFGTEIAGFYKVALALIQFIVLPINAFISTTYPELTRAYTARQWPRLRSLLRRVTLIAATWTGAVAVGLLLLGRQVLFGDWLIFGRVFNVYDASYLPAFPILLILLIGYGVANTLFWNRSLLLAQGQTSFALWVSFIAMLAKVAACFLILPAAGYLMQAGLLSAYFIVTVGLMTWRGLSGLRRAEQVQ